MRSISGAGSLAIGDGVLPARQVEFRVAAEASVALDPGGVVVESAALVAAGQGAGLFVQTGRNHATCLCAALIVLAPRQCDVFLRPCGQHCYTRAREAEPAKPRRTVSPKSSK